MRILACAICSTGQRRHDVPDTERVGARGLATKWYRWCDAKRNRSVEAVQTYDEDSLLTESGDYAALPASDFHEAFRSTGAGVARGSTLPGPRHRSFTVEVATAQGLSSLAVQLGRASIRSSAA